MSVASLEPAIVHDAWLSARLGTRAVRVDGLAVAGQATELDDALDDSPCFAYARVPAAATASLGVLLDRGFRVVDTTVTWIADADALRGPRRGPSVRTGGRHDRADAVELARTAFTFDRFHLDPAIEDLVADRIKSDWVAAALDGARGDVRFVATVDDQFAGFLIGIHDQSNQASVVDLVAVDAAFRGRGIASAMTAALARSAPDLPTVRIGTQAANLPAMNAYRRMGFSVHRSAYVLHLHHPG